MIVRNRRFIGRAQVNLNKSETLYFSSRASLGLLGSIYRHGSSRIIKIQHLVLRVQCFMQLDDRMIHLNVFSLGAMEKLVDRMWHL